MQAVRVGMVIHQKTTKLWLIWLLNIAELETTILLDGLMVIWQKCIFLMVLQFSQMILVLLIRDSMSIHSVKQVIMVSGNLKNIMVLLLTELMVSILIFQILLL